MIMNMSVIGCMSCRVFLLLLAMIIHGHHCRHLSSAKTSTSPVISGFVSTDSQNLTHEEPGTGESRTDHTIHLLVTVGVSGVSLLIVLFSLLFLCRLSNALKGVIRKRQRFLTKCKTSSRRDHCAGFHHASCLRTTVRLTFTRDPGQVQGPRVRDWLDSWEYSKVVDRVPCPSHLARSRHTRSDVPRPFKNKDRALQTPMYVPLQVILDRKRRKTREDTLKLVKAIDSDKGSDNSLPTCDVARDQLSWV